MSVGTRDMGIGGAELLQPGGSGGLGDFLEPVPEVAARTPTQLFWRRFRRDKFAVGGLIFIIVLVILALAAPLFANYVNHHHPNQIFVLDHVGKPRIRDSVLSPWRENLEALAERPHVFCKISGMVTEADYRSWTEQQLGPYFDTVLELFGPGRLMFGSDWPVCLVAASYQTWFDLVTRRIARLTHDERQAILGGTAARVYRV